MILTNRGPGGPTPPCYREGFRLGVRLERRGCRGDQILNSQKSCSSRFDFPTLTLNFIDGVPSSLSWILLEFRYVENVHPDVFSVKTNSTFFVYTTCHRYQPLIKGSIRLGVPKPFDNMTGSVSNISSQKK